MNKFMLFKKTIAGGFLFMFTFVGIDMNAKIVPKNVHGEFNIR